MKVALFVTCLNDTMFPDTGRATVSLLERLGVTVDFPVGQTCCGQMHINSGYRKEAATMMRGFLGAFAGYDAIVAPSSSCVGTVRHQFPKLADEAGDPGLTRDVEEVSPRIYDLSEFLVDRLGVEDVGAYFPHTVTYHSTCHSRRGIVLGDRPYRLLRAVRGLTLIDLPSSEAFWAILTECSSVPVRKRVSSPFIRCQRAMTSAPITSYKVCSPGLLLA